MVCGGTYEPEAGHHEGDGNPRNEETELGRPRPSTEADEEGEGLLMAIVTGRPRRKALDMDPTPPTRKFTGKHPALESLVISSGCMPLVCDVCGARGKLISQVEGKQCEFCGEGRYLQP